MDVFRIRVDFSDQSAGHSMINWSAPNDATTEEYFAYRLTDEPFEPIAADVIEDLNQRFAITYAPKAKIYPFPDPFGQGPYGVISEGVKEVVEGLEPNIHQVHPIIKGIFSAGDTSVVDGRHFILRAGQSAECVDMERSSVEETEFTFRGKTFVRRWLSAMVKEDCVVHAKHCAGLHLWIDQNTESVFCSGELVEQLHQIKADKGVEFQECTVI